jgi:putative ABC transport system permease protein
MGGLGRAKSTLTYDDVLALKREKRVYAATGTLAGTARLAELDTGVATTGVDEDFFRIRRPEPRFGRYISARERTGQAAVAVIGFEANRELFKGKNSVGKTINLNGADYRVVGVLAFKKPENFGPRAEDVNVKIYLPITNLLQHAKDRTIDQILVQAESAQAVNSVAKTIDRVLTERHHASDFSIIKQQDMLSAIDNILGILTAALGGIAAISLVVGGIGIMNIMLVSVTERTREIGVRKAIGAKRRDILIQFLIEAVVLSLLGGVLGLVLGILGSRALPRLAPDIHTAVSIPAAVIELLFAFLVGGFFGVYPAAQAARLDPIEALRSE